MDFNNKFHKQWKNKSKNNHKLLSEKQNKFSLQNVIQTNQTFSTTFKDQTETDSFNLRLSESLVEKTQENSELKFKENQINNIITISDTSSNDSIFSCYKPSKLTYNKNIRTEEQIDNILESSEEEFYINSVPKILIKEDTKKKKANEESDTDIEPNKVTQIIKETVANKSLTLSERKKKEIILWLSTNFNGSRYGSSCSQESIISNSRKSDVSSGNSSLERLELNFETPNNRGKLWKPSYVTESNKIIQKAHTKQSTIDQYFRKSKKTEMNIIKNKIFESRNSDKIPTEIKASTKKLLVTKSKSKEFLMPQRKYFNKTPISIKTNSRLLSTKLESKDSEISKNKNSNKTLISTIKTNPKMIVTHETKSGYFKTCVNSNFNKILSNNVKVNSNRKIISESKSFDSKISNSKNYFKIPVNSIKLNSDNIIISESDSFDSDRVPTSNIKTNFKKITPELNYLETNDCINGLKKNYLNEKNKMLTLSAPSLETESVSLKYNDNDSILNNSFNLELINNTIDKENINPINSTTINSTINDCADILENLYGKTWRNKARTLISATEPKKQIKKIIKNIQTEENNLLNKKNVCESQIKQKETFKKSNNSNELKNVFINDSTTESSLDYSYYTALTNPTSLPNNQLKIVTPSTIEINDNNNKKGMLSICVPESDIDKKKWKSQNNQRKLSFSSISSNTSEFDPEDIVLPRIVSKSIKIKKVTKFEPVIQKINEQLKEENTKKSFLASLSKNVPLENANFKAMVYRVKYNFMKEELCTFLFRLFNEQIFDNQLPDNMLIEWSTRLRGTAGKCYNKQSLKTFNNTIRSSRIILSTKILDSPDRLRDTLIHEMCHAATWLVNNVSDGHGSFWKAWAHKAMKVFPELPPISRCHNYEIQTKYTYKCTICGYNIGRHSKSLDLNRKRCGYCHGKFELLINKVTKTGKIQKKNSVQIKKPSGFALYVKENYQLVKQSRSAVKHGEVMKILGKQFSTIKITPVSESY